MKVERESKGFEKVTLVIESQDELNWLYALSNTSVQQAKALAVGLGFTLTSEAANKPQMALYNAVSNFYKGE